MTWDAVNTAAFYRIGWVNMETFRAVQAEGQRQWLDVFAFLDVVNRGQASQTLYELAPGVEYAFIVASVGQRFGEAAGWTDWTYLVTTAPPPLSCPVNTTGTPTAPGGSGAPTPTVTPTRMPRATATPAPTATPIPTPTPTITAQTPGQDGAGHWFYPTPTPTAGPVANVFDPTPTATPAPTPTPSRAANSVAGDRAALVALARSIQSSLRYWESERPLGEWYGVTTNSNGRVTRLDLSSNYLQGSIPAKLGNLSKLTHLYLANCNPWAYNNCVGLRGCAPASLYDVPNNDLRDLRVRPCGE